MRLADRISEEKVSCTAGWKDLGISKASSLLKWSVHFLSSSSYLESVANLSEDFLALEVDGFSFFFSGMTGVGEATVPNSLTAPITATVDRSTRVLSLLSLLGVASNFHASHFSFLSLYDGVASWANCSGVKARQNLQSFAGVSMHGAFPLSLQRAQNECPSKLAIRAPLLSRWGHDDLYTLRNV